MQFNLVLLCMLSFMNPFGIFYVNNQDIKGEYENQEYRYSYGTVVNINTDGLLIIQDIDTLEEVTRIVYDRNFTEIFTYVADVGEDEVIVVCERYDLTADFSIPNYNSTVLLKYNLNGDLIREVVLDKVPLEYYNHNNCLVMSYYKNKIEYVNNNMVFIDEIMIEKEYINEYYTQFQGEAYINEKHVESLKIQYPGNYDIFILDGDYSFSYSIILNPLVTIIGEKFNQEYTGNVSILSKGVIEINGIPYVNGKKIVIAGNYNIRIFGKNNYLYEQNISILPSITYSLKDSTFDFLDGLVVYEPISIFTNGTTVLINGELYHSELITNVGEYNLTIYGMNGMEYYLTFEIYPSVIGVENNAIYEELDFSVFGEATLNGKRITGIHHIEEPGIYVLDLLMGDLIYNTYTFTISGIDNNTSENGNSQFNYNYIFYILIALGGILILRKK